MKTNSQIRQESLAAMKDNWGMAILIGIIVSTIASLSSVFYGIPTIFVGFPVSVGLAIAFLNLVRGNNKLKIEDIFSTFNEKYYWKSVAVILLVNIYTFLWSLLLIVPGIIKCLSYSLAPYIIADNPDMSADEAINLSMKMMDGHKCQLFLIILGYIGFVLLSSILLFIPLLWLVPYYYAVQTKFYEEVKNEYNAATC